jgi:glycogen operon protein
MAERLSGSSDLFALRRPSASINYLASHDGATLADLTLYEGKHNEANGEDNRDGVSDNLARNWGVEGPTEDAQINTMRMRMRRSLLATLFWSRGIPMLLAGDELGRSQQGNNNAYCQDNEISWIDWSTADDTLIAWTARLVRLRREFVGLHEDKFRHGQEIMAGVHDLDWLDERGEVLSEEDWQNSEGRALAMRRTSMLADGKTEIIAFLMNSSEGSLDFTLSEGFAWNLVFDSAAPERARGETVGASCKVESHSCVMVAVLLDTPS